MGVRRVVVVAAAAATLAAPASLASAAAAPPSTPDGRLLTYLWDYQDWLLRPYVVGVTLSGGHKTTANGSRASPGRPRTCM